jgi:hypothetical protein
LHLKQLGRAPFEQAKIAIDTRHRLYLRVAFSRPKNAL